jgi:hypothetical protein
MDHDEVNMAISGVIQTFPSLLKRMTAEFEILTGRRAKHPLSHIELERVERQLRRLAHVLEQLGDLYEKPLVPQTASKLIHVLNQMCRLTLRRIPRDVAPVEYLIQQVKLQSQIPSGLEVLPEGLDYKTKHLGLQGFVSEVVAASDSSKIDALLQGSVTERQLVAQFQRAFNKLSLPKELRKSPTKITLKSAEKVKLALRDVMADWEALVNLVYGLELLKEGREATWTIVRRVTLWNKVAALSREPRLTPIVKEEWVTVRNSLDHGLAFFDPNNEVMEFPDRSRRVSWSFRQALFEGIDVYLANMAMFRIWNFVKTAGMKTFEMQLACIRELQIKTAWPEVRKEELCRKPIDRNETLP